MGITVQCDGRILIVQKPNVIEFVYKNVTASYYHGGRKKNKYEVVFSMGALSVNKPYSHIEIGGCYEDNERLPSVCFEFPFELRKIAYDSYNEIVDAMSALNMLDLTCQNE